MRKLLLVVTLLSFSNGAYSACGPIPPSPAQLNQEQMTVDQVKELEPIVDSYFSAIDSYVKCIDTALTSLNPEDEHYEEDYFGLIEMTEVAREREKMVVEAFSALILNAVDEPEKEAED